MKLSNVALFCIGLILLSIVVVDLYWWIEISTDDSKSFEQMKKEYDAKLPGFMEGGYRVTIFNLVLLSVSAFLFIRTSADKRLRIMCGIGTTICVILGGWMLFTLM